MPGQGELNRLQKVARAAWLLAILAAIVWATVRSILGDRNTQAPLMEPVPGVVEPAPLLPYRDSIMTCDTTGLSDEVVCYTDTLEAP